MNIFKITDYKIRSNKIFTGTYVAFCVLLGAVLLAEIFVDLKTTSLEILIPLSAISLICLILSLRFPDSQVLRTCFIISIYLINEVHIVVNPTNFHVVIYWFPYVALLALLIQGTRAFQIWVILLIITYAANMIYLKYEIGDSYPILIYRTSFIVAGVIYLLGILSTSFLLYVLLGDAYNKTMLKTNELEIAKGKIEAKKNLLEEYQNQLLKLTKDQGLFSMDQKHLLKIICETASKALKINRVSIWFFEENNASLIRKALFATDNFLEEAIVLKRNEYPIYFDALETKPFVMAPDATTHPDTMEFAQNYLKSLNIYSMLDCPIVLDSKIIGVICCENQFEIKTWEVEDVLFLQSLADFISISHKNERIKSLLADVRHKNSQLVEKNYEIESINEELKLLNEELFTTNDSLEAIVKHRTSELEAQNKQLTEYAFINSHLLRAPLARVLGLAHILTKEATSVKDAQLINALLTSTNELDEVVRKISDILYSSNNLTREDIEAIIEKNLEKD